MSELEVFQTVMILSTWGTDRAFKQFCCRRHIRFTERGYARWLIATQ
jgi:hypothetical protein